MISSHVQFGISGADGTPDWNTDKLSMYCVINLKRFQIGTIEVEHCSVARLSLNICILIKNKYSSG